MEEIIEKFSDNFIVIECGGDINVINKLCNIFKNGQVYALEANQAKFNILTELKHKNLQTFNFALANYSGINKEENINYITLKNFISLYGVSRINFMWVENNDQFINENNINIIKNIEYIYINSQPNIKLDQYFVEINSGLYKNKKLDNVNLSQVVLWGHKLHSHTHSYIHYGFKRAFEYMGYNVLWLDNLDKIDKLNLSKSLFITEGNVDKNIPLLLDCKYILHNCDMEKYRCLDKSNILILQVFTKDCYKRNDPEISKCFHFDAATDTKYATLYMPWATDLLPYEINLNISNIDKIMNKSNSVTMVGTFVPEWKILENFCIKNNIKYFTYGGYSGTTIDSNKNELVIQESLLAPAVQREWQIVNGYIPCRIFKNISYGCMGITHSDVVNDLFDNKLIYADDLVTALNLGLEFEKQSKEYKKNRIIELMEIVKNSHTYINRIQLLLEYFS